jgi:hypothetical protein
MPIDSTSFVFIISLAAVVNGLGIVRWLTGFSEFVRRRSSLQITHFWVFSLAAVFQFLLHVLFWWSLWSIRGSTTINFLSYLYLLGGPVFLFVGSAVLSPAPDDDSIDLRKHYFQARTVYSTVLILAWLWAIFLSPVLRGTFTPNTAFFAAFMTVAVVQRLTANATAHGIAAVLNWILLGVFVGLSQLQLGGSI